MILINLLPHREAARKRRRDAFNASLVASVVAGLFIVGLIYLWFQAQISTQQERNRFLQTEIAALEVQIKEIASIETEIAALRARQKAVEDLQSDRNQPVYLLNELARQLPDGVYITSLQQENQVVTLKGTAQSNERISELLRNLSTGTPWFTRPELLEIQAGQLALTPRDQRRVANFNMRVQLVRSSELQAAASAAAGVAPASVPAPPTR